MKTRVYAPSVSNLRRLASALRRGELVALPTETVYGLAANALDARACRKIFTAKRRPANDPLIVHVPDLPAAEALAEINAVARILAEAFWPGPLTLVLPKRDVVPGIVTSGQATVALRAPAHPLTRRILALAGVPLAAPSANPFGYVSPTTAQHVLEGLSGRIPHVLDGGPCAVGVESTIVDACDPQRLVLLRPGKISAGDLRAVLARARLKARVVPVARRTREPKQPLAPGMLAQHYSPRTPLTLRPRVKISELDRAGAGLIFWRKPSPAPKNCAWFTKAGDATEAARRLYAVLRSMDAGGYDRLVSERAPKSAGPLGEAINDRLTRAAARR